MGIKCGLALTGPLKLNITKFPCIHFMWNLFTYFIIIITVYTRSCAELADDACNKIERRYS